MNTLYVIGNGFDLYHDLPTKYTDYAQWLEDTDNGIFDIIHEAFGECDSDWWSDFEQNLASVDAIEYASNIVNENVPDLASDDFREGDWYAAEYAVIDKLSDMYSEIQETFTDWIEQIDLSECRPKINLDKENSIFLTFNYTDTIESVYRIESDKVYHIHGRASVGDNLVLGHGKDYTQLEKEETMPQGENVEFYEIKAIEGALRGVAAKRKPTTEIIRKHQTLFDSIVEIKEVVVLGLSFSDVDLPYLNKICNSVNAQAVHWVSNAFEDCDRNKQMKFFASKGIQNYSIINDISDLGNVSITR